MLYDAPVSLRRLLRACALSLLAAMLLLRVGPICEAGMAAPAAGTPTAMANCEQPPRKATKPGPALACSGGCIAVDPQPIARLALAPTPTPPPSPSAPSRLEGATEGPAPPPPRTA